MHSKEVLLPSPEHLEFPLQSAARIALRDTSEPEYVLRQEAFDRSIISGVLPYNIVIDALPVPDKPTPLRHAYITWARQLKHGFTDGCPGCDFGHSRHSKICRAKFDALFPREVVDGVSTVSPTPAALRDLPEMEEFPYSPDELSAEGVVSSHANAPAMPMSLLDLFPALVTRQLSRAEVLSCPDAIAAIKKEFDGVGSMGTWSLKSVQEESHVVHEARTKGETIHLADLLAICSERHIELEPQYRALKGRVCYRGDNAKTGDGNIAFYQSLATAPTSIVAANAIIAYGLLAGHRISSTDAVKAYLQSVLKSLAHTWIRRSMARFVVWC